MSDTGGVSRQHCQYLKFQWFRGKYGFVTARRVSDWFQRKIQICRRWPLGRRRKENRWGAPQVVPSFGWRVPHGWKQSILPSGNWRKGDILLSVPNDAHVSRTSKNIYLTERVCVCVCVRCGSGSFARWTFYRLGSTGSYDRSFGSIWKVTCCRFWSLNGWRQR